tara:strand:- start:15772 stop:16122 length:351 start_codon:yes stop_codon:yes gene_type:complete
MGLARPRRTKKFNKAEWKDVLSRLRYECGCSLPVDVVRTKVSSDIYGDCHLVNSKKRPRFQIRISKAVPQDVAYDILVHEWAHCLAWNVGNKNVTDHSPEWGVAFARVYCVVMETT